MSRKWFSACRVAAVVSVAGVVFALGPPSFAAQSTPALPSSIVEIENALRARAFDRAIELSQSAVAAHPDDYRIWTLRGMAYAGAGKVKQADAAYQQALQLRPDFLPALEGAAQAEFQNGSKNTEDLLRRVLAVRPGDATANVMLAMTLYKRADCKAATTYFERARPLVDQRLLPLSEYGVCLSRLGRGEEAVGVFQSAAALAPQDRGARYNFALALMDAKRYDDALKALAPDIGAGSTDENALTLAADIAEASNDTPQAVALLRQAIVARPLEDDAYLRFATLSSNHKSFRVGIDMLNSGLARMPKSAQLYLARGALYAQLGNYDKAMDDFATANHLDPRLSFAGTAEGITEAQRHDFVGSLAKFRQQVRQHPDNAYDHYLLAETLAQRGSDLGSPEYEEELRAAKNAVRLDPSLTVARGLLANLYLRSGKTELAVEQCGAALKTDPENQEALYRLILALRKTSRRGEIPSLTKRLLALRNAQKEKEMRTTRFQLVDSASGGR